MKFLIFSVAIPLLLGACQTSTKSEGRRPARYNLEAVKLITSEGENFSPSFSPSGDRILFVSRDRFQHAHSQIYEYDEYKQTDRRVTFQDGETFKPIYVSPQDFVYASTTDEIKEKLNVDLSDEEKNKMTEVYGSDLYGNNILRLTSNEGLDGEASTYKHRGNPHLLYVSSKGDRTQVISLNLITKNSQALYTTKDSELSSPVILANSQELYFIETKNKTTFLVGIHTQTKKEIFRKEDGLYKDLSRDFEGHHLVYSLKRPNEMFYKIERLNPAKSCTQVLLQASADLFSPSLTSFPQPRLVFTQQTAKSRQIGIAEVPESLGPCLEGQNKSE